MIKIFIKKFIKDFQDEKKRMIGHSHFLNMREKYENIKKLNNLEYKVFSQNGEDGIIDYMLTQLNIDKPKFIEIGVGDCSKKNIKFFFDRISSKK